MVVVGCVLLFGSNFNVVLPLFATEILHRGAKGFGFLSAAIGIGSLCAALWMAWSNRKPTVRSLMLEMLIFAIAEVFFAVTSIYPVSLILIAGVGFLEIMFAAQAVIMLHMLAPDHLRGRVMSVQVLFFDGSLPPGYLLMGWLAGLYGPAAAMLIGAFLCLLIIGAGWVWWKQPS